MQFNETKSNTN